MVEVLNLENLLLLVLEEGRDDFQVVDGCSVEGIDDKRFGIKRDDRIFQPKFKILKSAKSMKILTKI